MSKFYVSKMTVRKANLEWTRNRRIFTYSDRGMTKLGYEVDWICFVSYAIFHDVSPIGSWRVQRVSVRSAYCFKRKSQLLCGRLGRMDVQIRTEEYRLMSFIKAFLKDESGATMIEYGLVAALVSVAAIIALQLLGAELQVIFNTVSSYLASASGGGGS